VKVHHIRIAVDLQKETHANTAFTRLRTAGKGGLRSMLFSANLEKDSAS